MDYSKLRAAALKNGEDEEAVTVDTRALIDKVLARYSGGKLAVAKTRSPTNHNHQSGPLCES